MSGPVAIEDEPTQELPAVGPDAPAPAPEAEPASGAADAERVEPAEPPAPIEPPAPVRTIVIGDRDGLTAPVPLRPVAAVPGAVPASRTAKRGPLVFGDGPSGALRGELGADVDVDATETGDPLDGPALVIGPPRPDGGGPARTVVIGDADEAAPEPEIDPRIKDRRRRVLRAAGLRRLRWVLAVLAVVILIVGFNVTLRSPLFHVRDVRITGTTYIDPADLDPIVSSLVGTPLAQVDLGDVRQRVEENVWVRTVDVSRDWPRTLHIDIQERRPVAYYPGDDGLIHLVDVDGRVLMTLEGLPTQFVEVGGYANSAGPGEDAPPELLPTIKVANDLPETLKADTKVVRLAGEGVVLELKAGGFIILGDTTGLKDKLVAALAVRGQCPPGSYRTLDVRVPSRPAVSPKNGCDGTVDTTKP